MLWRLLTFQVLLVLLLLCGIRNNSQTNRAADPAASGPPDEIVESLLLVGDGGDISGDLAGLLRAETEIATDKLSVVFLGDNILPIGMPAPSHPQAQKYERALLRQTEAVNRLRGRAFFVPGNHDWANFALDGWDYIERQQAAVEAVLGPGSFMPPHGCAGPAKVNGGHRFTYIAMDSDWWFSDNARAPQDKTGCPAYTREDIVKSLKGAINEVPSSSEIILLTHHPLDSAGPARNANDPQAAGGERYAAFKSDLLQQFEKRPALICAAGHDHNLQIIDSSGGACRYFVISGSASYSSNFREGELYGKKGLVYGSTGKGFMRVDVAASGKMYISVITLNKEQPSGKDVIRFKLR